MASICADAISMNRSRMSRGTPISSVISAAGMRPTVVTKSTSAPGLDLRDELVGDLGDSRLQAPDQARPQRLHHDAADLAMTRGIRDHQALEVRVSHRELAVGDRPSSLGWAEVSLVDLLLRPLGKLVEDRRRIAGIADGEPVLRSRTVRDGSRRNAGAPTSGEPTIPSGSPAAHTKKPARHAAERRWTRTCPRAPACRRTRPPTPATSRRWHPSPSPTQLDQGF